MRIEDAVAVLQDVQTISKSGDGWELGWKRLATDAEVIQLAERFLRDIDRWIEGYDQHLKEMTEAQAQVIEAEITTAQHIELSSPVGTSRRP